MLVPSSMAQGSMANQPEEPETMFLVQAELWGRSRGAQIDGVLVEGAVDGDPAGGAGLHGMLVIPSPPAQELMVPELMVRSSMA